MRLFVRSGGLLALLPVLAAGCGRLRDTVDRLRGQPLVLGATISPAVPRPDLTMTATDGRPYDFGQRTKGRVTFITFGYTHCPDVCPVHMANLAGALKQLTPAQRAAVTVVFVTTDPVRDSLPQLRQWLASFDTTFVGLRGTDEQLAAMEQAFHIPPASREDLPGGGYGVSHSAQVFAFTPDDSAHVIYLPGMPAADYVHDIPRLLRGAF
ncbi:MAG: SCO family protein [Gemmatimonadota bacterium]|nr:SCO family protein [Gemmatimonadota bacterium]HEU4990482.1 SCO family protein [Gemmatimonadaceae bacterium]